jgi:hypothetical protein
MVQAASYPPLQKAQGRGTHNSGAGRENTERVGHPPRQARKGPRLPLPRVKRKLPPPRRIRKQRSQRAPPLRKTSFSAERPGLGLKKTFAPHAARESNPTPPRSPCFLLAGSDEISARRDRAGRPGGWPRLLKSLAFAIKGCPAGIPPLRKLQGWDSERPAAATATLRAAASSQTGSAREPPRRLAGTDRAGAGLPARAGDDNNYRRKWR